MLNNPTVAADVDLENSSQLLDVSDKENNQNHYHQQPQDSGGCGGVPSERFDYIPAPKWSKIQNSILEELFKKSRYPKASELKQLAQRFHVMDSDIEV